MNGPARLQRPTRRIGTRALLRRIVLLAAVVAGMPGEATLAQSGGAFSIARASVDAGGARSSGGGFVLVGTIGQPDATGTQGGAFQVQGGFHRRASGASPADVLFANGFE